MSEKKRNGNNDKFIFKTRDHINKPNINVSSSILPDYDDCKKKEYKMIRNAYEVTYNNFKKLSWKEQAQYRVDNAPFFMKSDARVDGCYDNKKPKLIIDYFKVRDKITEAYQSIAPQIAPIGQPILAAKSTNRPNTKRLFFSSDDVDINSNENISDFKLLLNNNNNFATSTLTSNDLSMHDTESHLKKYMKNTYENNKLIRANSLKIEKTDVFNYNSDDSINKSDDSDSFILKRTTVTSNEYRGTKPELSTFPSTSCTSQENEAKKDAFDSLKSDDSECSDIPKSGNIDPNLLNIFTKTEQYDNIETSTAKSKAIKRPKFFQKKNENKSENVENKSEHKSLFITSEIELDAAQISSDEDDKNDIIEITEFKRRRVSPRLPKSKANKPQLNEEKTTVRKTVKKTSDSYKCPICNKLFKREKIEEHAEFCESADDIGIFANNSAPLRKRNKPN